MLEVYLNGVKINPYIYGWDMNHIEKPEQKVKVIPCLTYSRVSGYFTNTKEWNPGKASERSERKLYKIPENLK